MKNSRRSQDLTISVPELERGGMSEDRVEECLRQMKFEGEIHDFIRTEMSGSLDNAAMDFLVVLPEGYCLVGLQVKSSQRGRRRHEESAFWYIPCVVVRDDMSEETLMLEVKKALSISTRSLEEMLVYHNPVVS